jgi:hypothetical protein
MTVKRIGGVLLILVSLTLACRTAPIHDVNRSNVPPGFSSDEVGKIIERAARRRGWSVVRQAPEHIVASIVVRGRHRASVDINFDQTTFSIRHRDSENLQYDGERIHRNYNSWIVRLERAIHNELFLQEQKRANSRT